MRTEPTLRIPLGILALFAALMVYGVLPQLIFILLLPEILAMAMEMKLLPIFLPIALLDRLYNFPFVALNTGQLISGNNLILLLWHLLPALE